MYITGEAICNKCGKIVEVNNKEFKSCENNHFSVKLGGYIDIYKGVGRCTIKNRKFFYTKDDFTELNEGCYEIIEKIKNLGVNIFISETKDDGDNTFQDAIISCLSEINGKGEYTELDLSIYLSQEFNNTTERVVDRLNKYYKMIELIKTSKIDLNDREKIEELNLFLDVNERQKELYDVEYYF